jgi:hypothetical protein
MAKDLEAIRTRANDAQERADTQQERIDLAGQELAQAVAVSKLRRTHSESQSDATGAHLPNVGRR